MNVLIMTANAIVELGEKHTTAKKYCARFLRAMRFADIHKPDDFLQVFRGNLISGKVSLIKGQQAITVNRIVFDLGGNGKNSFRVICHYQIGKNFARLYIKWTGTHEEYNSLSDADKLTIGYIA